MPNGHFEKIRRKYPRAYEKWTEKEDFLLREKYDKGTAMKDLAKLLQRQPGAIKSRLSRHNINYLEEDFEKEPINENSFWAWKPVFQEELTPYIFPNPITDFMRRNYRKPAIYRWVIEPGRNSDSLFYIGETFSLCPDRLKGYLYPSPKEQTNNRINTLLHAHKYNSATVKFEILQINGFFTNDLKINEKDLEGQDIRRVIERFLISLYRSQGVNLLNL